MTDTQLTMIIGFAGTIAAQVFQHWRTEQAIRERALELKEATSQAAARVENTSRQVAESTHEKLDTLKELQAENTRVTEKVGTKADAAYKEANDMNAKILDIRQGSKEKLERIDAITTDTNEVVQTLKPDGKP